MWYNKEMGQPSHIHDIKKHTDERLEQILKTVENSPEHRDDEDYVDQEDLFWMIQKISWSLIKTLLILGIFVLLLWFIWEPEGNPLREVVNSEESVVAEVTKEEIIEVKKDVLPPEIDAVPDVPDLVEATSTVSVGNLQDIVIASGWHEWIERMIFHQDEEVVAESITWLKDSRSFFDVPLPELIAASSESDRSRNLDTTLAQSRSLMHRSRILRARLSAQVNDFQAKAQALVPDRKARQQFFIEGVRSYDQLVARKSLKEKIELDKLYLEFIAERDARKLVLSNMVPYERMFPRVESLLVGNRTAIIKNIRVVDFQGDPFHTILTPAQWRSSAGRQ